MVLYQVVKKFFADGYLLSLQKPATRTSPEPDKSSTHRHSGFL